MDLKIAAYGKINLTLHITGKREDGYHTLDTIMQSVSLADILTVRLTEQQGVQVTCSLENLSGEENLVHKAAVMFLEKANKTHVGVSVYIEKNIPVAAGLGGGSTDAAALLAGLNQLFQHPFSLDELKEMALTLGADVPFCLVGGTQLATGIGDVSARAPVVQFELLASICLVELYGTAGNYHISGSICRFQCPTGIGL
jgi:4-diphosphocytidyl-2-C-methyl-D-erythritol kinase